MKREGSVEQIRGVRRLLMEEEKELGHDKFVREQRERVEKFLQGTRAKIASRNRAARRGG